MLIGALAQYFFGITIFIFSIFLILLVLVQRGRGGGLTGALGGPGGQSAFGTKAGDLFTRITIVVASIWIFLCAASVYFLRDRDFTTSADAGRPDTSISSGVDSDTSPDQSQPPDTTGSDAMPSDTVEPDQLEGFSPSPPPGAAEEADDTSPSNDADAPDSEEDTAGGAEPADSEEDTGGAEEEQASDDDD